MSNLFSQLGAFVSIGAILAVAATILAYIFIVPENRREKLNAFGKFLHDTFNFKYLIVEKILQALYIFLTTYVIILAFFMLFAAPKDYYGTHHWLGGYGILIMIIGPIAIRLVYELLMMAILLLKNVISINNKLSSQNINEENGGSFTAHDMSSQRQKFQTNNVQPAQSAKWTQSAKRTQNAPASKSNFCAKCGTSLDENGKCPKCDSSLIQS